MIPLMGAILLPLSLILWARPDRLIQLIIFAGIFPAASALTLGGFCLQPMLAPGLSLISFLCLQKVLGARYPGEADTKPILAPMIFNMVWAVFTSLAMPRLFAKQVLVWPQKADAAGTQALLVPNFGNVTQDAYLVANVLLMILTAHYVTRRQVRMEPFFNAFIFTSWVLVAICVWQLAARTVHVPFPREFFYSNTGWAVLDGQTAGPVPRINATFSEPSACAGYLAGVVFSSIWLTLKGYRLRTVKPLIWASSLALCLTTSTTGFIAMAVGLVLLPFLVVVTGGAHLLGRLGQLALLGGLLLGIGGMTVVTFVPSVMKAANTVASETAAKRQSSSYQDRSQTDIDALNVYQETYGLGAGWGSNRSSSLLPGLLASVGTIGLASLLLFDWRLVKSAGTALRLAPRSPESLVVEGFLAVVLGRLISTLISGPTIGLPDFYVMVGLVVGAIARVYVARRERMESAR